MTTREIGPAAPATDSHEALPFHRFVMEGAGPIQGKVLTRYLHAMNNLLTVTNGYVALLEANRETSGSLRALHDEAVRAGERAAAVSLALQGLTLGQSVYDDVQPAFVDELIHKLEPLLSAVTGRQVPVQLDLSARVGPVIVNPVMFLRVITACIAGALPEPNNGSICITVCQEKSEAAPRSGKALVRVVRMAQTGEKPISSVSSIEELSTLLRSWNGEAYWVQTPGTHWDLRILLPICDEERVPLCDGLYAAAQNRPSWRILLVEENSGHLRQLESGLLDAGMAVASFTKGSAALEAVRQDPHPYDVVITDILGADLTGMELARILRMESPCTHVVFSTTLERLAMARTSLGGLVIPKPFDMAQVMETVDSVCGAVRPRILVADDEESIRTLVRQCLSEETYEVLEAEDGLRACEMLQEREVQLLIVDLVMPVHEGLETIRSICRRGHKLKILAISGQRPEYLKAAGLLGADAVLRKPFTPSELRAAVARLLEDTLRPA